MIMKDDWREITTVAARSVAIQRAAGADGGDARERAERADARSSTVRVVNVYVAFVRSRSVCETVSVAVRVTLVPSAACVAAGQRASLVRGWRVRALWRGVAPGARVHSCAGSRGGVRALASEALRRPKQQSKTWTLFSHFARRARSRSSPDASEGSAEVTARRMERMRMAAGMRCSAQ